MKSYFEKILTLGFIYLKLTFRSHKLTSRSYKINTLFLERVVEG